MSGCAATGSDRPLLPGADADAEAEAEAEAAAEGAAALGGW